MNCKYIKKQQTSTAFGKSNASDPEKILFLSKIIEKVQNSPGIWHCFFFFLRFRFGQNLI